MSFARRALLLVLVSLIMPSSAFATWSGWYVIRDILVHDDSLEITLEGSQNCSLTYKLSSSTPNYDVKASALLAAYYSAHEVSVDYGASAMCATPITRLKVRR